MGIRIQEAPFDPGAELNAFASLNDGAGAIATFTGLVRSTDATPITALVLECYPELALAQLGQFAAEAQLRFGLIDVSIIHRHGTLVPGEPIVQVMTLAPHRGDAFAAAEYLMDYLKTGAPFWKKERSPAGERWVEPRDSDDLAATRWS